MGNGKLRAAGLEWGNSRTMRRLVALVVAWLARWFVRYSPPPPLLKQQKQLTVFCGRHTLLAPS